MAKNLVIVESPAKARTLTKYLGRDYQVKASVGHIMDLPKNKLGVDIKKGFAAEYHVIQGKAKVVEELRKAAKDKENIYLASDPDREGEAIAWHVAEKLDKKGKKVRRLLLNEITKKAVQEAIKHPSDLNRERYEAQIARRVLDRLVGYQISPLLWKKVRRGLSAGRVQSVAVRIITEREREIQAFVSEEYWSIIANLEGQNPPPFEARLAKVGDQRVDNKTFRIANEAEAKEILDRLQGVDWTVAKVEKRDRRRNPAPPFITSRLQQEASRKFGYAPARTMSIAQRLYTGVELGDEGSVGLITYMRTDSPRIAPEMTATAGAYIKDTYGDRYVPERPNVYRSAKTAQEAHEAIRPTSLEYAPERVAPYLSREELNLYTLIWNRFLASQMAPALFEQTSVDITADGCTFRATGQVLRFDGFLRVYMEGKDEKSSEEEDDDEKQLPPLAQGDRLRLLRLMPNQHFTQPPPRFTQAMLIKELEEKGIGRPSTYASIMGTILNKAYVQEDEQRRLRPTQLGMLVTDLLVGSFPDILNVEFTAGMEEVLDQIEEGQEDWRRAVGRFYLPFSADLERAEKEMRDVKGAGEPTDIACEECADGKMTIRWGRNGEFLACSNYPQCKSTRNFTRDEQGQVTPLEKEQVLTDETCEKCGKPLQVRFGRYGKFLGCSGYPECTHIKKAEKMANSLGLTCPECQKGDIQQKRSRRGKVFYSCSRYPQCTFAVWDRPVLEPCPQCHAPFVVEKTTKRAGTTRRCIREGCDYQEVVESVAEAG
ncbi:MAG: type I DNA topoisomerase [Deltaproteobacteria bacterium]|nr:MAG: type I DNA topoisomerase [Deltaproteobacteria bacterium]